MRCFAGRCVQAVIVVLFVPAAAWAQPVARTLEELRELVKQGEYVIVLDRGDRETWGQVADLSNASLTVAVAERDKGARTLVTADRRVFTGQDIKLLVRSDVSGRKAEAVFPASWEPVQSLPPGADLSIELESGERQRGRLATSDAEVLRILTASGGQQALPRGQIRRIQRYGAADPTSDGAVIGAAIGAGLMAALVAVMYATCDGCDAPARAPMFAITMGFGAGVGALTGWVADRVHKGKQVVFPIATVRF